MLIMTLSLALASSSPAADPAEQFRAALDTLEGDWAGVLEYRDYRSNRRIAIPHSRTVTVAPDASYVQTALSFTDPGYRVYRAELMTLDGADIHMAYASGGSIQTSEARLIEFEAGNEGWTAVLYGDTIDNGAPAQARYRFHVSDTTLEIEQAVRTSAGDEFLFRNGVTLTRD